jgi:hypothetical protein
LSKDQPRGRGAGHNPDNRYHRFQTIPFDDGWGREPVAKLPTRVETDHSRKAISYRPRISALARQFGERGFEFVFIYPNAELSDEERAEDARRLAIPGVYIDRGSFALAEALGLKSTGDVFVLDSEYRLRYRGAVDDQYGLGYTRDFPSRHYLRNALEALRNGDAIETPATAAPGCYIDADPAKDRRFQDLPGAQMMSSAIRLLPHQDLHS